MTEPSSWTSKAPKFEGKEILFRINYPVLRIRLQQHKVDQECTANSKTQNTFLIHNQVYPEHTNHAGPRPRSTHVTILEVQLQASHKIILAFIS